MGQTLTHGVYLPNEGERNCYNGLASNWRLLDGAIGTVAAHTTAIAGKADISHAHGNISNDGKVGTTANVPLITGTGGVVQAGAFGNQANTFCEGNDSRLSDARTPLAHTHTKSDVTDLLNSNFIPSANNTYDLGSSSYQWNNLYATTTNTDTIQSVSGNLMIHSTGADKGVSIYNGTNAGDGGGLFLYGKTHSNGSLVRLQIYNTTTSSYEAIDLASSSFCPYTNNLINLGTSTKKWKTLNGINPGALSLPGAYQAINDQIKDPNGQLNAFDLNGGNNTWVSDVDCYLYFYIPNNKFTWIRIFWPPTLVRCGQTFVPVPNESSDYSGFIPVPANTTVVIQIKGTQAPVFRRSACLGNV